MNIVFLTQNIFTGIDMHNIYSDLMKEFIKNGHHPYIVTPRERSSGEKTELVDNGGHHILKVQIGDISGVSFIKKGISIVLLENKFKKAIKKYLGNIKFDLVLYSTPPITLAGVIKYLKERDNAKTYLMLKDIFPQNAVDIGIMKNAGLKSVMYKYFRCKEKNLYQLSDLIGCMSQANVDFLLKNNNYIDPEKVHICPNCIEVSNPVKNDELKNKVREKYNIPKDVKVFVYGGNLGKPQDIDFIIECLKANADKDDRYFVICGAGSEYGKLKAYEENFSPKNLLLLNGLPKDEYDEFIRAFDVGLIFLDHRFTIPNFPSRILSYMENGMPVLACTDTSTDIGQVITEGNFGLWCESDAAYKFLECVDKMLLCDLDRLGQNSRKFLKENYSVEKCYSVIAGKVKI